MRTIDELLELLKVDDAARVTVAPLLPHGGGHSEQVAMDTAWGRTGKWAATVGGTHVEVSSEEARLLVEGGATQDEKATLK